LNRKMCHSYGADIYTGRRCLVQIKEIFNLNNAGKDLEGYVAFTFDILNVIQKEEQGGINND
ncbi:MAG: hypothetical protein IJW60_03120, partial [Clostridia bacterium]|nr:hypothetical protein [Clostridia bacterium]